MYKQLVESYFNHMDCENYWYVFGTDKIVVASSSDMYCDIYDDAKSCFEHCVIESIEMCGFEPWELVIFDEEELEFIAEHYPDNMIANMIEELMKERE
jgi:hypothetical protein